MALYKYERDTKNGGEWQMQEKRWGGPTEERLFNRFDPNPNNYYIAAENYQQAENRLNQPINANSGETERDTLYLSQMSKTFELQDNAERRDRDEVRRERFQELQVALGGNYNEYKSREFDQTKLPLDYHQREAVRNELYDLNEFSPIRSVAVLSYDDNPAETSHSFWERERNAGVIEMRQKQDEPYAERQTREQVLEREGLARGDDNSLAMSANNSNRTLAATTAETHAFAREQNEDSWER